MISHINGIILVIMKYIISKDLIIFEWVWEEKKNQVKSGYSV